MNNIRIVRCTGDEAKQYQGYVEPEDKTWRLFVDHEGIPHLLVETSYEADEGGILKGMISLDAVLPKDLRIKDLMRSTLAGKADPSDMEEGEFDGPEMDFGPDCKTL